MIYLDNAATTAQKSESVYKAMDYVNRNLAVNAGRGSYELASQAEKIIGETRNLILKLSNSSDVAEVVLTTSATFALNIILGGIEWSEADVVYVSPFEHNAVMRTLHMHQKHFKFRIIELELDESSMTIDLEKIEYQFVKIPPTVVCMSHVSNVTGYILPIEKVAQTASKYEAVTIIDGSQSLCLVPFDLCNVKADFYVFAGHKTLYGPFGCGGFITNTRVKLKPYIAGGTGTESLKLDMENITSMSYLEAGSPNITAIAGLNAALREIDKNLIKKYYLHEKKLTDSLIQDLKNIHGVKLYVPKDLSDHIGIVSINVDGYRAADIGMILDKDYDIAVRTGYHCAPFIHKYLKNKEFSGTVRVSVGRYNNAKDIDALTYALREIIEEK